ncbi:MAG: hypothetical protein N4A74_25030 [Carboxylicivirga sp.]|jgi:regulator of cell morphogenesis and NO signaling|nr:hypothetical protein [Carboxylicivirga sp.]
MYQTQKTYIKKEMVLSDLILENPSLLLLVQFFEIKGVISNYSIEHICRLHSINPSLFVLVANLYNGFAPYEKDFTLTRKDIIAVLRFLKQTHRYFVEEKLQEVQAILEQLNTFTNGDELEPIALFFRNYIKEVKEHLNYEEEMAFPYFYQLIHADLSSLLNKYSVKEYKIHHNDIETKLSDLKNILMKHVSFEHAFPMKRRLIKSLFELEANLNIHSVIEETILIPLVNRLEKERQSE